MSDYCTHHHGPTSGPLSRCPDPDLSDVLDDLREHVVPSDTLPLLGDCGGCGDDPDTLDTAAAVARVSVPGGGSEDACALHLDAVWRFWRRRFGTRPVIVVPACALTEAVAA